MGDLPGLMDRIRQAAPAVDPSLTDAEVERIVGGLPQRRRRRGVGRVGRVLVVAAFASLIIATVRHQVLKQSPDDRSSLAAEQVNDDAIGLRPPLQLADGSLATRLDARTSLVVVENSPARVTLELRRGRERFQVVPRPSAERSFHVRAGEVTVTVIGTVFTVERVADRIGVSVERGRVQVDWGQGQRFLRAGESGWFPPLARVDAPGQLEPLPAAEEEPEAAETSSSTAQPRPRPTATPAAAHPNPAPSPGVVPPSAALAAPSAEQLLRTADTARLAGRAAEAAVLLQRLIADWPDDPRAPLAAFTLGRLLMRDLGRPGEAAAAFVQARALAPAGPLAEDALAREAEALDQAGARSEARARAAEYLRLYPRGRRGPALKALGGGD